MNSLERMPIDSINHEWREKILSELFHVISQPLTGLSCLLEVSLMKKQTAAGYRRDIQAALEATSRVVESLRQARELAEADNPGVLGKVDFSALVREVAEEFSPLLEAIHVRPQLSVMQRLTVQAEPPRLRRAIFYLFDDVLRDLPLGNTLEIMVKRRGDVVLLHLGPAFISPEDAPEVHPKSVSRPSEIAERTICALGGQLCRFDRNAGRSYQVEIPAYPK